MSAVFHASAMAIAVPAEVAYDYISDGIRQGEWTFGSWDRVEVEDGLFRGRSLFDDSTTYVRIEAHPELLLIDYFVGPSLQELLRVNSARVVPGPIVGHHEGGCILTLMKWRTLDQSDEEWRQACATFDAEIYVIKRRLEAGVT